MPSTDVRKCVDIMFIDASDDKGKKVFKPFMTNQILEGKELYALYFFK